MIAMVAPILNGHCLHDHTHMANVSRMLCSDMHCYDVSFCSEHTSPVIKYRRVVRMRFACSSTSVRSQITPNSTATTCEAALKAALLFSGRAVPEHGWHI
jgi:hypothetical protein